MRCILVILSTLFLIPLHHQAASKQTLEERAYLWADNAINEIHSSEGRCSSVIRFIPMNFFCTNRVQLQREKLLRWIALLPEERRYFRETNEGPQQSDAVVLRSEEYKSILEEINRRDALTQEELAHYTLKYEPWPSLSNQEKIEKWFSLAMRKASIEDYSWLPFTDGSKKRKAMIEDDKKRLIDWIALSSSQRDFKKTEAFVQRASPFELQLNLYKEDRYLRAVVSYIDARDTLIRPLRNQERLTAWASLTFEERHRERLGENESDHYDIFLLIERNKHAYTPIMEFLGKDFINEVVGIQNQDREYLIALWTSLSLEEKKLFSSLFEETVASLSSSDDLLFRYRHHDPIPWFLEYQLDRNRHRPQQLSEKLSAMIKNIEIQKEVETILESSLNDITVDDLNAFSESYPNLRVKLFPINGNRCAAYPQTQKEDMRLLQIKDEGAELRLEVHDSESQTVFLLADNVSNVELIVNEPESLGHHGNFINYKTDDGEVFVYRPRELLHGNGYNIKENYHIKIIPQKYLDPVQVLWGKEQRKVNKFFRGNFRIEVTKKRNSDQREWSLVNDIPVEWYLKSVTPSELSPEDSNLEALKAQAIAARTYALSKAQKNKLVLHRGWDVDSSTYYQVYLGVEREHEKSNQAVDDTVGIVLTRNNQLFETEYHACVPSTTIGVNQNIILQARNIPSRIRCSSYKGRGGHGRGMSQIATIYLTKYGWKEFNKNLPSLAARIPKSIRFPWNHEDILFYFYAGVEFKNILGSP